MSGGPLGLAVLGCGRMGRRHIAAAVAAPGVRLLAVGDPVPGTAAAAAPHGVEAFEDVGAMLDRGDIEAVVIAAPSPLHVELTRRCLSAGKHVLVEKPVGLDPAAAENLADDATRARRVLAVGYWRRHAWPYVEAARLLGAGAIGEPRLVRASQWDATPPPPAFCDPAVSGGIEIDCGVHEIDVTTWLLGSPPVWIAAAGLAGDPAISATGDVEAAAVLVRTATGTVATIDLARSVGYDDDVRTEVVGARGALLVRASGTGELWLGDGDGLRRLPGRDVDVLADALARQLEAFGATARRAARGVTEIVDVGTAAATLRVALAAREARLRGEAVVLA